jgi:hypothetical protein
LCKAIAERGDEFPNDTRAALEANCPPQGRRPHHAWENRSNAVCRIAFVLIDGVFGGSLR